MYLGDNMIEQGLVDFVSRFDSDRDASGASGRRPAPVGEGRGSAARSAWPSSKRAVRSHGSWRSPRFRRQTLLLSASICSTARIHDAVAAITPSSRGELEITDAIQWLIDRGAGCARSPRGLVDRHGEEGPLLESQPAACSRRRAAQRRSGRRRVRSSKVESCSKPEPRSCAHACGARRSSARAPGSRTATSARTRRSAAGCEIVDSELDHSVVLERSRIVGIQRITDSLIGRDVEVCGRIPSARAAPDGRRRFPLELEWSSAMATISESSTIDGVYIVEPDDPRRRARLLRRDLPARVVPAGPRDDPGQPGRPPAGARRRPALPPAPGRLLVRPVRAHARVVLHDLRDGSPTDGATLTPRPRPEADGATTTAACSSRRAWPTASPPSPT